MISKAIVRPVTSMTELDKAMNLVWRVFEKFEAPEYSREGAESFKSSIASGSEYRKRLTVYGAYIGDALVGVLAMRSTNHIALFFVDEKYQGRGVGRTLFDRACADCHASSITVNSSPFALEIYHRLGFVDTDNEQTRDGIRYTPMILYK